MHSKRCYHATHIADALQSPRPRRQKVKLYKMCKNHDNLTLNHFIKKNKIRAKETIINV